MASWQIQEAKNKLSEVVSRALKEGPQQITHRGRKTAVVISARDYDRLKRSRTRLSAFFRNSPLHEITIERSRDLPREVEL